jgi:hypothetical protein
MFRRIIITKILTVTTVNMPLTLSLLSHFVSALVSLSPDKLVRLSHCYYGLQEITKLEIWVASNVMTFMSNVFIILPVVLK